ncbi:MAG: isoprenylcysteine carboxylmethyltransferase family protein [Deltaproteobacteria bacterium]|nr:isoprenylcysteine carboxylmethyltransferase family protein [Candidatus Zymogenaceae bacterium]
MIRNLLFFCVLIALLLFSAGRSDYWQGWLLIVVMAVQIVVTILQSSGYTSLAAERIKPGPGIKWWDKGFMALYFPLSMSIFVVGGLDAGRFGWTHGLPLWVYPVSVVVYGASFAFTRWAMQTNRWFSSVVRIQTERDQQVVWEGPYRFVRHPGYTGIIVSFVSAPFILGSLWALVPAGAGALLLIARTALEDTALQSEPAGYMEYAGKVKYRLLPGVW